MKKKNLKPETDKFAPGYTAEWAPPPGPLGLQYGSVFSSLDNSQGTQRGNCHLDEWNKCQGLL